MLNSAAIEWIGGALNDLNRTNGRCEAYVVVGGSGTGKTRFLGEIVTQWDHLRDLSAAKATADSAGAEADSQRSRSGREIPLGTLVFPISFNSKTPVRPLEHLLVKCLKDLYETKDDQAVIDVLAATRCLYACYDVASFPKLIERILASLENKSLNPKALQLQILLSDISRLHTAVGSDMINTPAVILIDEVSKIGSWLEYFIPTMNRCMDKDMVCIWTSLAEGPFERAETEKLQRTINKLFLPAMSSAHSLAILIDNSQHISKIKSISESLYLCWNDSSERVLVDWNDVFTMLSEAAGGLPRGVEKLHLEIEKMDLAFCAQDSIPLFDLLNRASGLIDKDYSSSSDSWQNSLYLATYKASLSRKDMVYLNPRLSSAQVVAEAICSGCLIDGTEELPSTNNKEFNTLQIHPIIPSIFPSVVKLLQESLKPKFNPRAMETYIVDWLVLWFKARRACEYGTADNNNKPILQKSNSTPMELWRPFAPFLDVNNGENDSILLNLDEKRVLEKIIFSKFPLFSLNIPGIYLPQKVNYEGLDAVVVIPSKSGRPEESVLIAVEAKNSLLERANINVYEKLPSQYERTVKRMSDAGWTPGINAFFYVMSKGQLDDPNEKKRLLETCPHMRVLAGEELKAAMGPTIYWGFKHLRILGAVYHKGSLDSSTSKET